MFKVWLSISAAYLLLTLWVVRYAVTCREMFCNMALWFPGLPWSFFLPFYFEFPLMWEVGITLSIALLNIAILYLLLVRIKW